MTFLTSSLNVTRAQKSKNISLFSTAHSGKIPSFVKFELITLANDLLEKLVKHYRDLKILTKREHAIYSVKISASQSDNIPLFLKFELIAFAKDFFENSLTLIRSGNPSQTRPRTRR